MSALVLFLASPLIYAYAHADGIVSEIFDGQVQGPTAMSSSLVLSTPLAKPLTPASSSSSSPSSIPNLVPNTTASARSTAAPLLFTSSASAASRVAMTNSATYPMNTSLAVGAESVNTSTAANATVKTSTGGMMGPSMAPLSSTTPGMPSSTAATVAKATGAAVGGSGSVGWDIWALGGFAVVVAMAG